MTNDLRSNAACLRTAADLCDLMDLRGMTAWVSAGSTEIDVHTTDEHTFQALHESLGSDETVYDLFSRYFFFTFDGQHGSVFLHP